MAKKASPTDPSARIAETAQLLVDAAAADTVYADLYLKRARELLGGVLPEADYQVLKGIERDIQETVAQSKAAAMRQDWQRVESLAGRVETLRHDAEAKAALQALGTAVYEPAGASLDPFSPGFESLPGHDQDLAEVRDALVRTMKALAAADGPLARLYESRGAFFAGLGLLSKRPAAEAKSVTGTAELEQLAAQAAHQGDVARLRRYAQEILARQSEAAANPASPVAPAPAVKSEMYRCPVDLAAPFAEAAVQRAQGLGMAAVRAEPLAQAAPLLDYVISHIWQPNLSGAETEHEGAMRTEAAVAELGLPEDVAAPVGVLVGQFLRNAFANSGGARYVPQFIAEAVLVEDFPEDQEPPAGGELLTALGLPRRRALARAEIDDALRRHGATILAERLGLDPVDCRLVCIPHDLYMRVGRDRGWGRREAWTHFDGYQVLKNGRLRALVGGDVRHGGLSDLVSIATTDQRECVVARFAVIRRARQVTRWR